MTASTAPTISRSALRGIACVLSAALLAVVMQACVRHLSQEIHPFEMGFFRGLFGILVVVPWLIRRGFEPFRTRRLGLQGLRAVIQVTAMMGYFYALSLTSLTTVTALTFTAPIFATVLAVFIFSEAVGVRRWVAILVGLGGTLVILRPGFADIGAGPLVAVMSAFVWGSGLIVMKALGRTDSSVTTTVYLSVLMTPLALIPALFVWQWPTPGQLVWLAVIGVLANSVQMLTAQALREAEAHVVLPFEFVRLIWATLIAYVVFAETPDLFVWLGGIMIFACTAYIAYGERRRQENGRSTTL